MYSAKIFVFTPRSLQGIPHLTVFFLETEEIFEVLQVGEISLIDPREKYMAITYRAVRMFMIKDRIIVHFRASPY